MTMAAPVVLFVHARPMHTRRTLEALAKNHRSCETDLTIYSDAAKRQDQQQLVSAVRAIARQAQGFKSVTLIEREKNLGLANNILDGVTAACKRHGRVIVLEDDLITSPHFLAFMNQSLDALEHKKTVWHISGWNYPIEPNGLKPAFYWRTMNCWGWATWEDRWIHYEKNPEKLIATWSKSDIARFDLDGHARFWSQVLDNQRGKIDTWAVFWYATIFKNSGLCLNPTESLVQNIGLDGSGENCQFESATFTPMDAALPTIETVEIQECMLALERIKKYHKKPVLEKIRRTAVRYLHRLSRGGPD